MKNKKSNKVMIIAGPCSVSNENIDELFNIADIRITNLDKKSQRAISGLRIVGLKSRSSMNSVGEGMGMDFQEYLHNADVLTSKRMSVKDCLIPPSVKIAQRLIKETGLMATTEIMDPLVQLPLYEKIIPKGKLLIWNPAVNQLGYQMYVMGIYAERNKWYIGIKNGKWFGNLEGEVNIMEKNWIGQISFATKDMQFLQRDRIVMIQRGVDVDGKGEFRNLPIHDSANKVKRIAGVKMFFDPSHSLGPLLRNQIVDMTINAMHMKTETGEYLYDGILIEAGTSGTDTKQHVTVDELQIICDEIAKFRYITSPD